MIADTGGTFPAVHFPMPLVITVTYPTNVEEDHAPTFNSLCEAAAIHHLGCQLNELVILLYTDHISTIPPCAEDFRDLWCPWDESLKDVTSAFWAFTDRIAYEEVRQIMSARGAAINLCSADVPAESRATLTVTMFLVDFPAVIDLVGRLYSHTSSLENRLFLLRQDYNALRDLVQHILEAVAARDPALAALQELHKR